MPCPHLPRCAFLLVILLAGGQALAGGVSLRELARADPRALAFSGERLCLLSSNGRGGALPTEWMLHVADHADAPAERSTARAEHLEGLRSHSLECGPAFATYLALAQRLCSGLGGPPEPQAMATWMPPADAAERVGGRPAEGPSYWDRVRSDGCLNVTSSTDGRARIIVAPFERPADEGARGSFVRGRAWLAWRGGDGAPHAAEASPELHLDTIIDDITPLPGTADLWVVTGLRSYLDTFAGRRPRRYAWVLRLGDDGRLTPVDAFGGRGPLLLASRTPSENGKFRADPLAKRRLVFNPAMGSLELAGIGTEGARQPVATLKDGRFEVQRGPWGDTALARGWGTR